MDEYGNRKLRETCLSCTYPTGGLVDDEEIAELQLDKGLCGWCAGQRVRWREQRRANLARKAAGKEEHGRFGWWWRRVFMP